MKRLIYILFLVCSPLLGQYPGMHNGSIGTMNGHNGRIQADDIPTSPESSTPESPEVDTFNVLRSLDFDVFAVQDSVSTDTISAHVSGYYDLIGDGDGIAEYMSIIEMANGDRVAKAIYLINQCCTENTDDDWDGVGS